MKVRQGDGERGVCAHVGGGGWVGGCVCVCVWRRGGGGIDWQTEVWWDPEGGLRGRGT